MNLPFEIIFFDNNYNFFFSNARFLYLNKNTGLVEEISLLQKKDLRNCLREVVKGSEYDSNISQYMNYESIQNKLKSFKNNTLQTTGKDKVQFILEISSDNVPALTDQVINLTMDGQTL
jgi:hypothetical protein